MGTKIHLKSVTFAITLATMLAGTAMPDIDFGGCCPPGDTVEGELQRVCEGFWWWQDGCVISKNEDYAESGSPCNRTSGYQDAPRPYHQVIYDVAHQEVVRTGWFLLINIGGIWQLDPCEPGAEGGIEIKSGCFCQVMSPNTTRVHIGTRWQATTCGGHANSGSGNPQQGPSGIVDP